MQQGPTFDEFVQKVVRFNSEAEVTSTNTLGIRPYKAPHQLRAMEVAVRKLSKRLKVTITPQTTWRQMTGRMDDKIKGMPEATDTQKRKKNKWEEARANLHHVGSVYPFAACCS
jgi:hypothetical protein